MKALILSDIHSNITALEAIWAQEKDSDLVYCAGDVVDYGPHPCEVIAWLQTHNVHCVQGNHDAWVCLNYRRGQFMDVIPVAERGWVNYNTTLLSEADICYLEQLLPSLTFELDGIIYGLTHLYQDYEEIVSLHVYEQFRQSRFADIPYTRLIMGHTHRQAVRYLTDDLLWLNPGSVSYRRPDDPDQTAHYATIVDGRISLHRLPYDLTSLYAAVQTVALNPDESQAARRIFGPREVNL
jgi:putative phosphoesterase